MRMKINSQDKCFKEDSRISSSAYSIASSQDAQGGPFVIWTKMMIACRSFKQMIFPLFQRRWI